MSPSDAIPEHLFAALGVEPRMWEDKIGGAVTVFEKHPALGPVTVMTMGVSRLTDEGQLPVELAVEVVDGQQDAARVALGIVCDNVAQTRSTPPFEAPWINDVPFLNGTAITSIVATGSRWGAPFDEIREADGTPAATIRTLRLLSTPEAEYLLEHGWAALVERVGSLDHLLDVERSGSLPPSPAAGGGDDEAGAPPSGGDRTPSGTGEATPSGTEAPRPLRGNMPVILSALHEEYPPRWVTRRGGEFTSVTGLEDADYMADASNHTIWSVETFVGRFPWVEAFLQQATPGQTARFTDASGGYELEDD